MEQLQTLLGEKLLEVSVGRALGGSKGGNGGNPFWGKIT